MALSYKFGISSNMSWAKIINIFIIKLPNSTRENITAIILGTKERVCYCTCVVDCKMLRISPTTIAMMRTGAAVGIVVKNAFLNKSSAIV